MNNPFNFVWLCDAHRAPANDPVDGLWVLNSTYGLDEYRRYSTFQTRIETALTEAKTLDDGGTDISFFVQSGDFVTNEATDDVQNLIDGVAVVNGGDWAGAYLDVIGNHEKTAFVGNWAANYFANLLGRTAADHEWTDNDDESDAVAGKAYSVDIDGWHIIVLYAYLAAHTMSAGQKTWLTADLAAHDMPTIVFTHAWISGVWPRPSKSDYVNIANASDVRTILEGSSNVQAVFQAHFHLSHTPVLINDIWYFHGVGSVEAPGATDNAYFLVEIIPNAYMGANRLRANVQLTRYGTNTQRGLVGQKDYEHFLIGST